MLCLQPFVRDPYGKIFKTHNVDEYHKGIPFPCGQCLPCRINKRRRWMHRLLLERLSHVDASFITLTYSEETIPQNGTVRKRDLQLFFKRLRKFSGQQKLRYYACGEYGSQTHRPHYHAIVFGLGLDDSETIARAWHFGRVHVGECTEYSIQYVAGYVTKKFVRKDNGTLEPEFALMSRRPGLGTASLVKLAGLLQKPEYQHLFPTDKPIPDGLRHGRRFLPFDRFCVEKLYLLTGKEKDPTPFYQEMADKFFKALRSGDKKVFPLLETLLEESAPRNEQIKRRFKIFNQRSII